MSMSNPFGYAEERDNGRRDHLSPSFQSFPMGNLCERIASHATRTRVLHLCDCGRNWPLKRGVA